MKKHMTNLPNSITRRAGTFRCSPVLALFLAGASPGVFLTACSVPKSTASRTQEQLLGRFYDSARGWFGHGASRFLLPRFIIARYLHQALAGFQRNHRPRHRANFTRHSNHLGTHRRGELASNSITREKSLNALNRGSHQPRCCERKRCGTISLPIHSSPRAWRNLRQKRTQEGSALYGGYRPTCQFTWKLKTCDRELNSS